MSSSREATPAGVQRGGARTGAGLEPKSHTTQPPARYTEASLVKELEAKEPDENCTAKEVMGSLVGARVLILLSLGALGK